MNNSTNNNNYKRGISAINNGQYVLKCPICGRPLIVEDDQKRKLKTRIVIFLKDKTLAKCKFCHNDIEVPVKFDYNNSMNG